MIMLSPYDPGNQVIPVARNLVKTYVREVADAGQLPHLALNRASFVSELARTLLSAYVIRHWVTIAMIDRWMMEAISSSSQQPTPEQLVRACIRRIVGLVRITDERLLSPVCREDLVRMVLNDTVCRMYIETQAIDRWDIDQWIVSELEKETNDDDC